MVCKDRTPQAARERTASSMGYEELIQAIGEQARRQCDEILAHADEEARAVIRAAETQREGLLGSARARGAEAAAGEASRIVSAARIEARREISTAQIQVVEAALCALDVRLGGLMETREYREILGLLLAECLVESSDPVTVRCRREDRQAVEEHARRLDRDVRIEEADMPLGGLETAAGPEGRFVCRNSIADRLEWARPLLLQEAGLILLGLHDAGAQS